MKSKLIVALLILATGLLAGCVYDPLIVDRDYVPRRIISNISQVETGVYAPRNVTIKFRNRMEIRSEIVDLQFLGQLPAADEQLPNLLVP